LTTYANGAVVPTDTPSVATATTQHLAAKGTPILQDVVIPHVGYAGYPYAAHLIGKREAESEADPAIYIAGRAPVLSVGHLTTYANGAVVPTDTPSVAAATTQHLAAKGTPILQDVVIPHVGYAGYPYAAHLIGKREAESEADPAIYIAGRAPVTSVGHLTTYANGAVVPTDTPAVAAVTAQHLALKGTPILQDVVIPHVGYAGYPYGAHLIGKREAESEADPAIYIAGRAPVTSVGHLTTYANGAVVPTDTPAVAAVTAQHLALKGTPILQDVVVPHVGYAGYAGWPIYG